VGQHDPGYVDSYYGPGKWARDAAQEQHSLDQIQADILTLQQRLEALSRETWNTVEQQRCQFLTRQLRTVATYVNILRGQRLPFDQETALLYGAVAPAHDAAYFRALRDEIEALLPGEAPLAERVQAFRRHFVIPSDRLAAIVNVTLAESRQRTLAHIELPPEESVRLEYVNAKPWRGYHWYQGNYHSLIQINIDLPIFIEQAVELACHEGYPGHHANNVLLEKELVRARGWIEFSVQPLFSLLSLSAESMANYGIDLVFPAGERLVFERELLYPLADLDVTQAERYFQLHRLLNRLSDARLEAARRYLDGEWSRQDTVAWLVETLLWSPEQAEQGIDFIETYRSYVINYTRGQDLVKDNVEKHSAVNDLASRWRAFSRLLVAPWLLWTAS
jgi:hypothetical protein